MSKKLKTIPFEFILEELYSLAPLIKPMFGCHAIYVRNKIVLIVRLREEHPFDNGVWIATTVEHHESLRFDFPSLRSIKLFGGTVSAWQNLPCDADDFEESVLRVCGLIRKSDPRIGKIPKPRKRRKD
jgi:hypothetical protein